MLQFEELKKQLNEQVEALDELKDALGLEKLREEVEMLENKSPVPPSGRISPPESSSGSA